MSTKKFALAGVLAALTAAPAFAALNIDANLELDNTVQNQGVGLYQGGRVETNISARAENAGNFVAAKGTLLLKKDGSAGTDDMWVQFGNASYDVKLGRFEAADLFPLGKDTLVLGAENTYKANVFRGRNGSNTFHGALNMKLSPNVGFELGLVRTPGTGDAAVTGIRPVFSFGAGAFAVKLGLEHMRTGGESDNGFGITGSYKLADGNLNLNYAHAEDADTFGANATFGALGLGAIFGEAEDINGNDVKGSSVYAAYTMPLFGIKGASVTPALSFGKVGDTKTSGARVRINYAF